MTINSSTGLLEWMALRAEAAYIRIMVTDSKGFYDDQRFIVHADANRPPVITSVPVTSTAEGQVYQYAVVASDPDGDDVHFSLDVVPEGMTIEPTTQTINWTPTRASKQDWDRVVSVSVSDQSGLSTSQTFTITVRAQNDPPVLTPVPALTIQEGDSLKYLLTAEDPDDGALTYSIENAPIGMHLNESSGWLSWRPQGCWMQEGPSDIGDHDVTVTVRDPDGLSGTGTLRIAVRPAETVIRIKGPSERKITLGEQASLASFVELVSGSPITQSIVVSSAIAPNDGGITLTPSDSSVWTGRRCATQSVFQSLVGTIAGIYEITTTATISETGQMYQRRTIVRVTDGDALPTIYPLGALPDAIPIATPVEVLFSTSLSGSPLKPLSIAVEELDPSGGVIRTLGQLVDDGLGDDLVANDSVFSGKFTVSADMEGILRYRAKATFPEMADPVYTELLTLPVTHFPVETRSADLSKVVVDPSTQSSIISNRISVSFTPGTTPETIESIVGSVGGEVVGTSMALGFYQVEIPDSGDATGVRSAIDRLKTHPEVVTAEPYRFGALDSSPVPQDEEYSEQWSLPQIGADKAWVVARGNTFVAVLDTGVDDIDNLDLSGKLSMNQAVNTVGTSTLSLDRRNVHDEDGHGTFVTGIIAAETNKYPYYGMAGVSWDSKVLPIKVAKRTTQNPPYQDHDLAEGIKWAAAWHAKIINISLGGYFSDAELESAVASAIRKGSLVVAAAGNDKCDQPLYPAAYPDVLSVGATDKADRLWGYGGPDCQPGKGSNFGSWVRIVAPGEISFQPIQNTKSYAMTPTRQIRSRRNTLSTE